MASTMSKRDVLHVAASGEAAKKLHQYLLDSRNDMVNLAAGSTLYHQGIDDNALEGLADPTGLADCLTVVNSLRARIVSHLASTGQAGAHAAASAEVIAAPVATDLTTANALANELKADFNTHLTETGVHLKNDVTNAVTAADATDQGTLETLLADIKAMNNAHVAAALTAAYVI
jgi:hypothetical protein